MNIALLIAGGAGNRMGQDVPKQFLHVDGRPVIIHTMTCFQMHPDIDAIAVVCLKGWDTKQKQLNKKLSWKTTPMFARKDFNVISRISMPLINIAPDVTS